MYGSPESSIGDEKSRAMFSKSFYQKNTVAVVCDEVHAAVSLVSALTLSYTNNAYLIV